ncbi:hypothetical protein [Frigoribacterium sp. VKM Ac-2836]|uniref:hypothetical protein n=1 Tax=Frigoribacterium sp. VKM Ac-2836 TaxID=2739014 RepID=UPI0015648FE0|nr:hypothetical protein [Frigoribacterium sp. VKM Ac-2836]NRD27102.1 hypothetical protein [Frigoribacterium sp. VKM Ac-2836]
MTTSNVYFVLQGDVVRPKLDIADAAEMLQSKATSRLLALVDSNTVSETGARELLHFIELRAGLRSPNTQAVSVETFLSPILQSDEAGALYALEVAASERVIVFVRVRVGMVAQLFSEVQGVSWDALASLAISTVRDESATLAAAAVQLKRELEDHLESGVMEHVELLLGSSSRATTGELNRELLTEVSYRASTLQLALVGLENAYLRFDRGNTRDSHLLHSAGGSISSIAATLAHAMALEHQQRAQTEMETREREKIASDRRTASLSRLAAVFVFPSLWFAFLGANVFPSTLRGVPVNGGAAMVGALLGAGLSALIGLWIVGQKLGDKK